MYIFNMHLNHFETFGFLLHETKDDDFLSKIDRAFNKAVSLARESSHKPISIQKKWIHSSGNIKHLVNPHRSLDEFRTLIESEPIRQKVRELFGATPMYVTHSKISYKVANIDQVWLPHQDSAYKLRKSKGATFAIFLEDCNEQNGTLELFPKSHLKGRQQHEILFVANEKEPQIKVKNLPKERAFPMIDGKGSILCMNLDTIHQSGHNRSQGFRCIFIFEVEAATGYPLEQDGSDAILLNLQSDLPKPFFLPLKRSVLKYLDRIARPVMKIFLLKYYERFKKKRMIASDLV